MKIGDFAPTGAAVDPKYQVEGVAPPIIFSKKTRLNDLSVCITISTDCHNSRVCQTRRGQTDRQTDRILIARPRLRSAARYKRCKLTSHLDTSLARHTLGKEKFDNTSQF